MSNLKLYQKTSIVVLTGLLAIVVACGVPMEENSSTKVQPKKVTSEAQSRDSQPGTEKHGYISLNNEVVRVPYRVENGAAIVGDDMVFDLSQIHPSPDIPPNLAAHSGVAKWPGGVVPYVVAPGFPFSTDLANAIQAWAPAGITWKPRTTEAIYVTIAADTAPVVNWCGLYTYGSNLLQIKSTRASCGKSVLVDILHEMAHALGMMHEHQRSDRNSFLKGIPVGSAYDIITTPNTNLSPFDLGSITIYPTSIIPSLRTISGAVVADPVGLSQIDLDRTSAYYFGNLQCSVIGGAGTTLFSGLTSKYGCASQCNSRSATNPERSCSWNNAVFVGLSQCSIVGGLGTVLFNSTVTKFQCTQECNSRSITNPDRSCTWNNVIFAGAAQCSIVGGLGTSLYSAVVAKYPCVQQCRSRATTHVNRSCVWNGTNIKGQ